LSPRAAHGLHLRCDRGGAWTDWRRYRGDPVSRLCLAWFSYRAARTRPVWTLLGDWRYQHDCDSGLLQYERGTGPASGQRNSSALYLVRRLILVCDAGQRGRLAQYQPTDGLTIFHDGVSDLCRCQFMEHRGAYLSAVDMV